MALPGKLWKLKEWLTVPEAARHLSIMFGEEVSEAHVLRLALDGHLRLSVIFEDGVYGRHGKAIPYDKVELFPEFFQEVPGRSLEDKMVIINMAKRLDDYFDSPGIVFADLDERVFVIEGLWDLPMYGCERSSVEHEYQMLTGNPYVRCRGGLDGTYVQGVNGKICQLQEKFVENESQSYLTTQEEIRKERSVIFKLEREENREENEEKKARLRQEREDHEKLLNEKFNLQNIEWSKNFYPAGGLPDGSVLVVRTSALGDLQMRLEKESETEATGKATVKDGIGRKERPTWLKIIYLLAMKVAAVNKNALISKGRPNASAFETLMKSIANDLEMVRNLEQKDRPEQVRQITYGMSDANFLKIFNEGEKIISRYFE